MNFFVVVYLHWLASRYQPQLCGLNLEGINIMATLTLNKYYSITAIIDNSLEVLFSSFDKSDCKYELQSEKESWKAEGYKVIRITHELTTDKPDTATYGKGFKPDTEVVEASDEVEKVAVKITALISVGGKPARVDIYSNLLSDCCNIYSRGMGFQISAISNKEHKKEAMDKVAALLIKHGYQPILK